LAKPTTPAKFSERKKRRELEAALEKATSQWFDVRGLPADDPEKAKALTLYQKQKHRLEVFQSDVLLNKAQRLGIEVPRTHDWWYDDYDEQNYQGVPAHILDDLINRWLSPKGRIMVAKLIRDERRKNIEWWVKIAAPLIGALISLLGLIVALVTVSRR
jgi:hypothetical protein